MARRLGGGRSGAARLRLCRPFHGRHVPAGHAAVEAHIVGLVLLSTAPDASWLPRFVEMTGRYPLSAVATATAVYERAPINAHLCDLAVASAEWNFTEAGLDTGRALLARFVDIVREGYDAGIRLDKRLPG